MYRGGRNRTVARQIGENRLKHRRIDQLALFDRAKQQQPRHELVDSPRHAAGGPGQLRINARLDCRIALPADVAQAVFDIGADLARLHRIQMMAGDHPLAQLLQRIAVRQRGAEFWLAEQQRLQQRMAAKLEVGQHPQLF